MKVKKILITVVLIAWMVIVWNFSSQNGQASSNLSGGILTKIFNVSADNKNIQLYEFLLRKTAHFSVYFLGSIIFYNFLKINNYAKNKYLATFLFIFFYASTDELHQRFVADRSGQISDVILDSCGGLSYLIIKKLSNK